MTTPGKYVYSGHTAPFTKSNLQMKLNTILWRPATNENPTEHVVRPVKKKKTFDVCSLESTASLTPWSVMSTERCLLCMCKCEIIRMHNYNHVSICVTAMYHPSTMGTLTWLWCSHRNPIISRTAHKDFLEKCNVLKTERTRKEHDT